MSDRSDERVMQRHDPTPLELLDTLLSELATDEHRREALCELLAPGITGRLPTPPQPDGWLDARGAARYLSIGLHVLHRHAAKRAIPFHQGGPGTKLYFRRSELDAWRARNGSAGGA